MLTFIRDSFKYFIPFFVVICSFVIFLYIKSNTKTETHIYHNISNGVNVLPKQSFSPEEWSKNYYYINDNNIADKFNYIKFLSQKYPKLYIYHYGDKIFVKDYADVFSLKNNMGNNGMIYLSYDFINLQKFGFKVLYISRPYINYAPELKVTFTGYGSWQQLSN